MDVTLSLEDEVVRRVEKLAAERDTTLTGLVRDYLVQLSSEVEVDEVQKARNRANLERVFNQFGVSASPRTWTRAELYERK